MKLLRHPSWLSDETMWRDCANGCGEKMLRVGPETCSDCAARLNPPAQTSAADRSAALVRAGVPEIYRAAFVEPNPWPGARSYDLREWRGDPWCVTLSGAPGVGKSFLAVELLFRAIKRGRAGRWVRAAAIPSLAFAREEAPLERVRRAGCLVLDDLGRGHAAGAWPALADLLADRYEHGRPVILTTNVPIEDLADLDVAIGDRLAEGLAVVMSGESKRRSWAPGGPRPDRDEKEQGEPTWRH